MLPISSSLLLLPLLLSSLSSATVLPRTTIVEDGVHCRTFTHPISASAMNLDLSFLGKPANQQAQVQNNLDGSTTGSTGMAKVAAAPLVLVNGTYDMYFEYCYPLTVTLQPSILQLIHGLVGNAGYWKAPLTGPNGTLSFAKAVAKDGYATLSYDRLCVGKSATPDGTQVCQIAYEEAQAIEISKKVRDGSLGVGNWSSVVGVGHSYGSALLAGVAAVAPTAFEGTVLTGFTANSTTGPLGLASFQTSIASGVNATAFGSLANDYFSTPSVSADQAGFFHYPNFSNKSLQVFTTTKGAYTAGQMMSIAGPFSALRPNYTAPIITVTGENDGPFCAGNCLITSLGANKTQLDTTASIYPGVPSGDISTFVVPASGHGINFHSNAPQAYSAITAFLKSKGL